MGAFLHEGHDGIGIQGADFGQAGGWREGVGHQAPVVMAD